MPDGSIRKQVEGIPMGDPLSPACAVGTCAWMEMEWMQTLDPQTKERFAAKRFMDDILLIYDKSANWHSEAFVRDFQQSLCYMPPLKLEEATQDIYLETRFQLANNTVGTRLKNVNEHQPNLVWKYKSYSSYDPPSQKRGVLLGVMRKLSQHASTDEQFLYSAACKFRELCACGYPRAYLRGLCHTMAQKSKDPRWFKASLYC